MLGSSMGLPYQDLLGFDEVPLDIDPFDFIEVDGVDIPSLQANALTAWWDFTDTSTLWKNHFGNLKENWASNTILHPSLGSTNLINGTYEALDVNTNGDVIARVDNKAYWLQNSGGLPYDTGALGSFLQGSRSGSSPAFYKTGGQNGHSYVSFNGLSKLSCGLGGLGNAGTGPQSKSLPLHGYYAYNATGAGEPDSGWQIASPAFPTSYINHLFINRITMFFVIKASANPISGRGRRVISLIDDGGSGNYGTSQNKTSSIHFEYWRPADGSDPYYRCRINDGFVCTQTSGTSYAITSTGNDYYINSGITGSDTSVGLWTLVLGGQNASMLYKNGDTSNGNLTESSSSSATSQLGWSLNWGADDASDQQRRSRIIMGNRFMHRGVSSDGTPSQNNISNCTTCETWMCNESQQWGYGTATPTTSSDQIYEILIYRDKLNETQRSQVETYLKNKYNL